MTHSPKLSIIIITWNDADRLERCLKSIMHCKDEIDHETIVVDNGSNDHTLEMLERFNSVKVIKNQRNLGMAPARNIGIKNAKGSYLFFLDSDTEIYCGCLMNAVKALESNRDAWIGGCKTYRADGTLEYNAKSFYTLQAILYRRTFLGKVFPNSPCLHKHLNQDKDYTKNFDTDWVAGAALIVRREAIEKLGGFDERFTHYFDDYDLCYRAWKMGGRVIYIADSPIVHYLSLRSHKSILAALRHLRSGIYFYLKTLGLPFFQENRSS
jgi:N-acetylglucosaminyl-diphospho-decaprenol L-rhamnosyltransferase